MTESSRTDLPAASPERPTDQGPNCPSWCTSDHRRDKEFDVELDDALWFHRGPLVFTIPTSDGQVDGVLERVDGVANGPGGGLRLNFGLFDVAIDDVPAMLDDLRSALAQIEGVLA